MANDQSGCKAFPVANPILVCFCNYEWRTDGDIYIPYYIENVDIFVKRFLKSLFLTNIKVGFSIGIYIHTYIYSIGYVH